MRLKTCAFGRQLINDRTDYFTLE